MICLKTNSNINIILNNKPYNDKKPCNLSLSSFTDRMSTIVVFKVFNKDQFLVILCLTIRCDICEYILYK